MYILDAVPMFLATLVLCFFHPGRLLQGPDSSFPKLSRKEKKRIKQEKKEQKKARKEEKRMRKKGIYPMQGNDHDYSLDAMHRGDA
jgi:hypothetical protein